LYGEDHPFPLLFSFFFSHPSGTLIVRPSAALLIKTNSSVLYTLWFV
jgi:hypothetical protein